MKRKTLSWIRIGVLALFLVFISYEAFMHQVKGGGPEGSPSIHALCPYGGLESLYSLFTSGTLVSKIYLGTLVLFALSMVLALLFRRGFCGWICPFGGLQELLGRLGRKIMGKQLTMPLLLDKILRLLKYPVLILTAFMAWYSATLWFSPYDPWAAYGHLGEGLASVWSEFAVGFILLMVTLVGSFFYDRFFCKYLCPMGGFLGLVSKVSPFKIKREEEVCINCNMCSKVCPMNIDVAVLEKITSLECINCQECTAACPKEGALNSIFAGKAILKPFLVGFLILAVYLGGIGIAKVLNLYPLLPEAVSLNTVITDEESIKGYMTLSEISLLMDISLEELYEKMEIPGDAPADTPAKELSEIIDGFDFHEAKAKLFQ